MDVSSLGDRGGEFCGEAWSGSAWRGSVGTGRPRPSTVWCGMVRRGKVGSCEAWRSLFRKLTGELSQEQERDPRPLASGCEAV